MRPFTGFPAASTLAFHPIEVTGLFIDGFADGGDASTGIKKNPAYFDTAVARITAAVEERAGL